MKQTLLLAVMLLSLAFASCNKNEELKPGTYADAANFAIVNEVEDTADSDESVYTFTLDSGKELFLTDSKLSSKYEFVDGQRVVIYYTIIENYSKEADKTLPGASYDCDYGIRLFGIEKVAVTIAKTVTNLEESKALADHKMEVVYNNVSYNNDFINLQVGVRADKLDKVKYYLVDNQQDEADKTEKGFYNLELRYDRMSDEAMGYKYDQRVSLDLKPFADQFEAAEAKGVIIRAVNYYSGTVNIRIPFEDEDDDKKSAPSVRSTSETL